MSLPELDNLVRIGQLKLEPCNAQEVVRMPAMAQAHLSNAQLNSLSLEGRFTSAGTATTAKTVTPFFSACRILWAGSPIAGGC